MWGSPWNVLLDIGGTLEAKRLRTGGVGHYVIANAEYLLKTNFHLIQYLWVV